MVDYRRTEVLTNLAIGIKNPENVYPVLFPEVPVSTETVMVPKGNTDYLVLYDTERADGARSNRIMKSKDGSFKVNLSEHDLECPIDWKKKGIVKNIDGSFKEEDETRVMGEKAAGIRVVKFGIELSKEYKAAMLAQDLSNYAASNQLVIASPEDKFSDPDSDVLGIIEGGRTQLIEGPGVEPNTCIINYATYSALRKHPQIKALLAGTERKVINKKVLADLLGFETLKVGQARVKDTLSGELVNLWGNNMIMAYIPPRDKRDLYEPNFGFSIVDMRPTSTYSDEYDEKGSKVGLVRHTETREIVLADSTAGYIIKDTI